MAKRMPHFIARTWETWNRKAGCTVYHCTLYKVTPTGLETLMQNYSDTFCSGFQVIWQAMQCCPQHFPKKTFDRHPHTNTAVYPNAWALREAGICIVSEV